MVDYFSYLFSEKSKFQKNIYNSRCMTANTECHLDVFVSNICKQLTSLLVARVSCVSPWVRQEVSIMGVWCG